MTAMLLPLYALTLGLSALLLFWVQPLFARLTLPLLGGAPAVWITAMLFFQAALLAGYLYAHLSVRWLGLRRQSLLHGVVLLAAIVSLPIALPGDWAPPAGTMPVGWQIGLMAAGVGLPFFAVSATAPLLQRWFAHTGHAESANPYFLYSASNIGSIAALVGYPVLFEPRMGLAEQGAAWTWGYAALAALIALCGVLLWRRYVADPPGVEGEGLTLAADITWSRRLWWTALAFAPSSLMLGATLHISTDVAAVPLFWVVPLALYLLTFVIVFARRPILPHRWMLALQPVAVLLLAVWLAWRPGGLAAEIAVHLGAFFLIAMACHGELAARRPAALHLTEFYLWMAVGGVLGGLFNAVVAPLAFDSVLEYPLAVAIACLLMPWWRASGAMRWASLAAAIVPAAAVLAAWGLAESREGETILRARSFFGVSRVARETQPAEMNLLIHGTTVHGAQRRDPAHRTEPLAYFHRAGPLGQLFRAIPDWRFQTVGVIGLGAGATACYARDGEDWTFFEIDPLVERIARDERYFTYLADCAPRAKVVIGDARLSLQDVADGSLDLLVLDAFTSDAIPVHLLTREAFLLYRRKLAEDGILMAHISNEYLDLEPVIGRITAATGLFGVIQYYDEGDPEDLAMMRLPSVWVAMVRRPDYIMELAPDLRWQPLRGVKAPLWTDDYVNIVGALQMLQPERP